MWLFSKNGFISAVRNRRDNNLVMIRSYFKGDIERILARSGIETEVVETADADYYYRANVTNEQWSRILVKEAECIDYDNFKNAIEAEAYDSERYDTYLEVHGALSRAGWTARH